MLHPVFPQGFSASKAVDVSSVQPAQNAKPNPPRFLRALPTVAASGLALGALFKPAVAQAQGFLGFLPEEAIQQMSAAVGVAQFSPRDALIGGAAVLATGLGLKGLSYLFPRLLKIRQEKAFNAIVEKLESGGSEDEFKDDIKGFLYGIRDKETYAYFARKALLAAPLSVYTTVYLNLDSAKLTGDLFKETFKVQLRRASVDEIDAFVESAFSCYGLDLGFVLDLVFGPWDSRGDLSCEISPSRFDTLVRFYAKLYKSGKIAKFNYPVLKKHVESAAVSGNLVAGNFPAYEWPEGIDKLILKAKHLAVLLEGVPESDAQSIIDLFVEAHWDSLPHLDGYSALKVEEAPLSDLAALYPYCHSAKTRSRVLKACEARMQNPDDYFKIAWVGREKISISGWQEYSDWLVKHLSGFFEKGPTLDQIHTMDGILSGRFVRGSEPASDIQKDAVQTRFLHAASRWALASGAYANSARDYFGLVVWMSSPWLGAGMPKDPTHDFQNLRYRDNSPLEFAQQTIHSFAKLNPSQDEMIEFIKLYPKGYSRIVTVYNLAKLGAIKTPEEYLALTDPELLFEDANGFNPPAETTAYPGSTMVTRNPLYAENMLMRRIYKEGFRPLIAPLANDSKTAEQHTKLRHAFLKRSAFLLGYVELEETPDDGIET